MSMTYLAALVGNVAGTMIDPIIIGAIALGYLVTRKAEGKCLLTVASYGAVGLFTSEAMLQTMHLTRPTEALTLHLSAGAIVISLWTGFVAFVRRKGNKRPYQK
jgi:hypothetical protein